MLRSSVIIALLFFASIGLTQVMGQNFIGQITDSMTGKPISGVALLLKGTIKGMATDAEGLFRFNASAIPAVLMVSHVSYISKEVEINFPSQKLLITLKPRDYQLPGPDIKPNLVLELMKGNSYDILDYGFLGDDILLLANRNGSMFQPCLVLVNLKGDTLCTRNVSKPSQLYRDFEGNICFISRLSAWSVANEQGLLSLTYIMDKEEFLKTYPAVVDRKISDWILRRYAIQNQVLDYFLYNEPDSKYTLFCSITNQDAIARTSWGPYFHGTEADEQFARIIINRPVYAPLFRKGDSLVLFDYLDDRIEFYNDGGTKLGFIPASFMHRKGCKKEIYKDEVTGNFFVHFLGNGISTINKINLNKGTTSRSSAIPGFIFIEKITIRNDEIFFLYRDKTASEQKKIYRMKL